MAEKLLQRTQIGAACKQVRCKAVAQSVGREAFRQSKPSPRRRDRAPDQIRIERTAARANEQRPLPAQRIRALPHIAFNRFPHRSDNRHHPGLGSLSGDSQSGSNRQCAPRERKRLGNTQSRAVKQQQDRKVAGADPRLVSGFGSIDREFKCFVGRRRTR